MSIQNSSDRKYRIKKCESCKRAGTATNGVCDNCGQYPGPISSYRDCPHNPVHMWSERGACIKQAASKRKRVKHVVSSGEVPHLWFHKVQDSARTSNGTLFFEGDTIYSYGHNFPIARHVQSGKRSAVLFTNQTYSVTTSGHCSQVRAAIPERVTVFHVAKMGDDELKHATNISDYLYTINEAIGKCARARSSWGKEWKHREAVQTSVECREYCKFFRLKLPKLPTVPALDSAEMGKIKQRESKRAAEKAEETRKQREEQAQLDATRVERWRNGEFVSNLYNVPVMLRLSADKTEVETSQGVKVPVSHALRALRFVRAVVAKGEEYKQNGHTFHIGHYTIDRIETNGTLHAGCHVISLEEIERFAPSLACQHVPHNSDTMQTVCEKCGKELDLR